MNKVFEYYEDAYGIKFNRLYVDKNSLGYKQLMKALDQDIEEDNEIIFQIIKDGVPNHIIKGLFSEKDLKKQLIEQKILGEEYKDIDTFMDSDFKYNKDETYNVLYINASDKNIYEYRKLLVKNKIKSLIIYAGNITQRDEEQSIREKLNIPNNTYDNLPILIKMKNKEIINSYNNISLNDLVKNTENIRPKSYDVFGSDSNKIESEKYNDNKIIKDEKFTIKLNQYRILSKIIIIT